MIWNNWGHVHPTRIDYIDKDGFRANVGIVLTRGSGELFLGGRVGGRGWQFPQGGVNRGEQVEEALFRELKEEIGLDREDVEVLGSTRGWLRYRLPRQYVRDRCIGQKQRWFLLKLIADESKLRFDCTDQPEFDRWRWADYWTPVREVVYFKRRVYVRALHDLGKLDVSRRPAAVSGLVAGDRGGGLRIAAERTIQKGLTTARIDDADQQQRRHLVEDAIPLGAVRVAVAAQNPAATCSSSRGRRSATAPAAA